MREFFRGWKRKMGVVTLGFACVFMGAWVRSITMTDSIFIPVGKDSGIAVSSVCGTVGYFTPDSPRLIDHINWHSQVTSDLERMYFKHSRNFKIPYWFIVFPPTLLSAYLLVSKPKLKSALLPPKA